MPKTKKTKACVFGVWIAVWTALAVCYYVRPDSCAVLTAWPAWAWSALGIASAIIFRGSFTRRGLGILLLVWLLFTAAFCEEPISLMRSLRRPGSPDESNVLRVVSLNCSGGSVDAANEVVAHDPDIVLLQESPGKQQTEALARRLFGKKAAVAWDMDTSVLARGRLISVKTETPGSRCYTRARVRVLSGKEIEIVSLRLSPPVFRLDLWSPTCWRDYASNQRTHRAQLKQLASDLSQVPADVPVIVGGDFNAPRGDGSARVLRPNLTDAFRSAGRGWGNTALNNVPVLRFDQVWLSAAVRALSVKAVQTRYSDHRMVVCDMHLR